MFDGDLAHAILLQIDQAIEKIRFGAAEAESPDYFTNTSTGMERLDGVAMLFIAIGESLKNIDKFTGGALLTGHPEIDWAGVKGFRDIIAHRHFDIVVSGRFLPLIFLPIPVY
jgi:uncharacterized protein with HEPN domain